MDEYIQKEKKHLLKSLNCIIKNEYFRGSSQNTLDKWRYSVKRKQGRRHLCNERFKLFVFNVYFEIKYCLRFN